MKNIIKFPQKNKTTATIYKLNSQSGIRVIPYDDAISMQETANYSGYYTCVYTIGKDYTRCFIIPSTKEETDLQISYRQTNPEEVQLIISKLKELNG